MKQVQYALPEAWCWKYLDDVSEKITDGTHHSPKVQHSEWEPGRFKYITSKNIKNNGMKLDDISYIDQDIHDEIYARCAPELEDQLLTKDGAMTGTCCLNELDEPFSLLSSVALIKQNRSLILPKYLNYYLQSHVGQSFLLGDISGAAITRTNIKKLKSTPVPLAPYSEQKHIVEKLDALLTRIDTAIKHLQESVTLADALLKSSLSSMLTKQEHWDKVRLNDVCQITSKLCDPREEEYLDMFHIGGANITSFSGELIGLKTAREEKLISGKFPFDNSMVLYSKIRPYLMKVARPSISGICSADIYPLKPDNQKMNRDFLFYLLLSDLFTQYAIEGSSRAGMPKVNRNHLFNFEFFLPPIDEQKSICESLDALVEKTNEVSKELTDKLSYLAGLKASILDSAFKGEL
ncbi:restriction endonuclease subunit S [Vibrio sp. Hep-1b-8]|uniref:restriction endonuclease subunit S n=1 Tax=Vibrio sp. Hep-1b-8 TaxID=2144187 RepID=UPI0014860855|nr:restriction endonuclease subunit S [Vibrio sp. Hep-1b-8]